MTLPGQSDTPLPYTLEVSVRPYPREWAHVGVVLNRTTQLYSAVVPMEELPAEMSRALRRAALFLDEANA